MKVRRKRKKKKHNHKNIEFIAMPLGAHCLDLVGKFTLVPDTPIEFGMKTFAKMPFSTLDKIWERYGVARVFDAEAFSRDGAPLLTCYFRQNVVRSDQPSDVEFVFKRLFSPIHSEEHLRLLAQKEKWDSIMTYLGSTFMKQIGLTTGRMREYGEYMNQVSSYYVPVEHWERIGEGFQNLH